MDNESKDIKIPIKAIVEQSMMQNGAKYEEDEFNLLRKYFIACLNLGYLMPKDLVPMVNKFSEKIKFIVLNYNNTNKLDYYVINGNVLYINGYIKDNNPELYEITFYKAVTEAVFKISDKYISFSTALCEMVGEKIYNMDVNSSRIIMPELSTELIGDVKHNSRSGYMNYSLIISLLKQFVISKKINENFLIKDMFFKGYDVVINETFNDENSKLLLEVLDKIFMLMLNRRTKNSYNPIENELINKYQLIVNSSFDKIDQGYFAFCALITTDELRQKCMKLNENK